MIYTAILAHLISDYVIQTDKLIQLKQNNRLKGNVIHALEVMFITFAMYFAIYIYTGLFNNDKSPLFSILIASALIGVSHFAVDIVKTNFNNDQKMQFRDDLIDQAVHLILIFLILRGFQVEGFVISNVITLFVMIAICMVIGVFWGDITIKQILTTYPGHIDINEKNIKGAGSIIGKIERAVMLLLMIQGYAQGIVTVFAIKSVIRFQEFKQKDNDYYILGNLLSLFIIVATYMIWTFLANPLLNPGQSFIETLSVQLTK